jgi:hypothetical protein
MKKVLKIVYAVLVLIILALIVMRVRKSGYAPIVIQSQGDENSSIFDLKHDLSCVPGPQEGAASYTKSLTPGGLCGDQKWVADQATYTITDGIGSSLLS